MIKKMTKYTFVLFHQDVEGFLSNLQDLGVVDITRSKRSVDAVSKDKFDEIDRCHRLASKLESVHNGIAEEFEKGKESYVAPASLEIDGKTLSVGSCSKEVVESIVKKLGAFDSLKTALKNAATSLSEAKPWGEFDRSDIKRINDLGLTCNFYTVSNKRYSSAWEKDYAIKILNEDGGNIYFVVVGENKGLPVSPAKFPAEPASVIESEIASLESEIVRTKREILFLYSLKGKIDSYCAELFSDLDIYLAKYGSKKEAEETIVVFEGFAPTEIDDKVASFLKENSAYYFSDAAKREDNPPIQLKNNFFAKLYEPIGELYMLPTYGELDLTLFFAPFYMLFFGLCLGDMGYGLVLVLAGLYVNFKVKEYANYGKLVAWLGFGSIIMPALNGTFFGAKIYDLFPAFGDLRNVLFDDMKMFWFAIIFGIVQIVFARVLNAIYRMKHEGFTAGLGNIGWAVLITWISFWYYYDQIGATMPSWAAPIVWVGLALILLFSSDSKNIVVRIFKGTTSLYDITGVFGDTLSYIRLFGLGTAGGILGYVVNSVAVQLGGIPYLGWFFMILMLVVGHLAVLLLSSLGAFVHPMRLTFVEFYKNAGFEGGGREYSPLKKVKNN